MTSLRFDNRVVIVTGAGAGLGRSHALDFARRGAKVVVNDLGGGTRGGGADKSVAQQLVDQIKATGGDAVANGDSVEEGHQIVQCAMDHFGRVDVLVNNAGILRDSTFHKLSDEDWDAIYRVHLLGTMRTTRVAWPHMRAAGYGRVILTTSAAGLYGNFGQTNYSAAKLGIVGLGFSLAVEGQSKNILVNAVAPIAGSRLTATVLPQQAVDALKPEYVTPLVTWLCHEDSQTTGSVFEVGGGWVSQTRWEQTQGVFFKNDFSAEEVLDNWQKITSFENARHGSKISETRSGLEERLGEALVLKPQ